MPTAPFTKGVLSFLTGSALAENPTLSGYSGSVADSMQARSSSGVNGFSR